MMIHALLTIHYQREIPCSSTFFVLQLFSFLGADIKFCGDRNNFAHGIGQLGKFCSSVNLSHYFSIVGV